MNYTSIIT